eukprot:m.20603 g.20603  ORF g.20603 m.20603 type:complete len:575 (+) comp12188_c0_seq1:192-1916(+)
MMQQQNQHWQQQHAAAPQQLQSMQRGPTNVDTTSSANINAFLAAQQRNGFMQRPQESSQVMSGRVTNGMHQFETSLPMSAASGSTYSDMQGGAGGQGVDNEDEYHNSANPQFWQQLNPAQLATMTNRMASQMAGQNHDGTLDLQGMQHGQQGADGMAQYHTGMVMLPMAVNPRGLPAVSMTSNGATTGFSFPNMQGMPQMQAMNNMQFQSMMPFAAKYSNPMNPAQQNLNAMAKMPQSQHGVAAGGGPRDNDPDSWQAGLIAACRNALYRLKFRANAKKRSDLMEHIKNGPMRTTVSRPCLIVSRANQESRSPFQVTVRGNRILAQKAIYAGYNRLSANDLGTWAVQQTCRHSDGSWWCFEPSHLEKCPRDHLPAWVVRLPAPGQADAIFVARARRQQKKATDPGAKNGNSKKAADAVPKSPGMSAGVANPIGAEPTGTDVPVPTNTAMQPPASGSVEGMPPPVHTPNTLPASMMSSAPTGALTIPENGMGEKLHQPVSSSMESLSALHQMPPATMAASMAVSITGSTSCTNAPSSSTTMLSQMPTNVLSEMPSTEQTQVLGGQQLVACAANRA